MSYACLIPLFPLLAFTVIIFNQKQLGHKASLVAIAGVALSGAPRITLPLTGYG